MAIAFRSSGAFSANVSTSVSVALPTGHAQDDLLLMHISRGDSTAFTAPSGWTLAAGSGSWTGTGTRWTGLMWKWDSGSESAPSITAPANGAWAVISAFSGVGVKASPFNITPVGGAANGVTKTGAAMTSTTITGCMPVWFFQNGDNGVFNAATSPAVAMYNGASYDSVVGIDTSMAAIYKAPQAIGSSGTGSIACASGENGYYLGVMLDPTVVATGPPKQLFRPF